MIGKFEKAFLFLLFFLLLQKSAVCVNTFSLEEDTDMSVEEENLFNDVKKKRRMFFFTIGYENYSQYMGEYLYNYNGDQLVSRLTWKNNYTSIFKVGFEIVPFERVGFGVISRFSAFKKKNGNWYMKDEDWLKNEDRRNYLPYIYSLFKDGKFEYLQIDAYLKFNFLRLGDPNSLNFKMYAYLGFIYNSSFSTQNGLGYFYYYSLTDPIVANDGIDGLKYGQKMFLPYFGLSAQLEYKNFVATLTFKNSILNSGKAYDWHYARTDVNDVKSVENYSLFYNYSIILELGYWLSENTQVFVNASFFETIKKHTQDGTSFGLKAGTEVNNSFGMSNKAYSIGAGLTFGF